MSLYGKYKACLLVLPAVPVDVSQYITVKTNGYGGFYFENGLHEYSADPHYANIGILVRIIASENT